MWEIETNREPYEGMDNLLVAMGVMKDNLRLEVPPNTDPVLKHLMERKSSFFSLVSFIDFDFDPSTDHLLTRHDRLLARATGRQTELQRDLHAAGQARLGGRECDEERSRWLVLERGWGREECDVAV